MKVVVTTGAISRAKLQSNHHQQQTNTQFLYRPEVLPVAQTNSVKAKLTTINNGWVNYYFSVTTTGHNTTKANIAWYADVAFLCESGPVYDWLAM